MSTENILTQIKESNASAQEEASNNAGRGIVGSSGQATSDPIANIGGEEPSVSQEGVNNSISQSVEGNTGTDGPILQPQLPTVEGSIGGYGGQFKVSGFTGFGSVSFGGLSYSIAGGNGEFGFGFGAAGGAGISRRTNRHTPTYNDSKDTFEMGGAILVPYLDSNNKPLIKYGSLNNYTVDNQIWRRPILSDIESGTSYEVRIYRPRAEGAYEKIQYWKIRKGLNTASDLPSTFWRIISSDNSELLFGVSKLARMMDKEDESKVYQWMAEEHLDAAGHCRLTKYIKENTAGIDFEQMPWEKNHVNDNQKYLDRSCSGHKTPIPLPLTLLTEEQRAEYEPDWFFESVYDYGQYANSLQNLSSQSYRPYTPEITDWELRMDPHSNYSAGFEIRTYRLCRNILEFHYFSEEFKTDTPLLHSVTQYLYDESPIRTLLMASQQVGYYWNKETNSYETKYTTPVEVEYSNFDPKPNGNQRAYRELLIKENGSEKPFNTVGAQGYFTPVDLYGEGIPGMLYSDGQQTYYYQTDYQSVQNDPTNQPNTSPVYYSRTPSAVQLPVDALQSDGSHQLMDLLGNGLLDFVVMDNKQLGYYQAQQSNGYPDIPGSVPNVEPLSNGWGSFVPVPLTPTEYALPQKRLLDVTGNSSPDCVIPMNGKVRFYPNNGVDGFGGPVDVPNSTLPSSLEPSESVFIGFVGIGGDGKSHLVRADHTSLAYFPNYGYGVFGEGITMGNFPNLTYEEFKTNRVFFQDLDGTGAADMIIATDTGIKIYQNQSGNTFVDTPIIVDYPNGIVFNPADRILFADVYGNGLACMIYCQTHPTPRQFVYDFNGGVKPYLMTKHINNIGAVSETTYQSSVHYYLKDKEDGIDWYTRAPFPSWTVRQLKVTDLISKTELTESYWYRDNFYDGIEKVYRGYGYTEHIDTQKFTSDNLTRNTAKPGNENAQADSSLDSPPAKSCSWMHTGNQNQAQVTQLYITNENGDHGYFRGDPDATVENRSFLFQTESSEVSGEKETMYMGNFYLEDKTGITPEIERQAALLMKETLLRTELYGMNADTAEYELFMVSNGNATMKVIQPLADPEDAPLDNYASIQKLPRESLNYSYERNPYDPMMTYSAAINFDQYGHVLQECGLIFPRRSAYQDSDKGTTQLNGAQHTLWGSTSIAKVDNLTDPGAIDPILKDDECYFLGVPIDGKNYFIENPTDIDGNLDLGSGAIFTYENVQKFLVQKENLNFPDGTITRLLGWKESTMLYVTGAGNPNPQGKKPTQYDNIQWIDLGRPGPRALILPEKGEQIVFEESELQTMLDNIFQTSEQLNSLLIDEGRYSKMLYPATNQNAQTIPFYSTYTGTYTYHQANKFYQPESYRDPFDAVTAFMYDKYNLMMVWAKDAVGNIVQARKDNAGQSNPVDDEWAIDYQLLHPYRVIDENNNKSEVLFDALGRVITTSHYGDYKKFDPVEAIYNSESEGFVALHGTEAGYHTPEGVTLKDVIDQPMRYLQDSANYAYYGNFHWMGQVFYSELQAAVELIGPLSAAQGEALRFWYKYLQQYGLINGEGAVFNRMHTIVNSTFPKTSVFYSQLTDINESLGYLEGDLNVEQNEAVLNFFYNIVAERPACVMNLGIKDYPNDTNARVTKAQLLTSLNDPNGQINEVTTKVNDWMLQLLNNNLLISETEQNNHHNTYGIFTFALRKLVQQAEQALGLDTFEQELLNLSPDLYSSFQAFGNVNGNDFKQTVYSLYTNALYERLVLLIHYSDGSGRSVQSKIKAESGEDCYIYNSNAANDQDPVIKNETGGVISNRWLTQGHTRYNNKGLVVLQFDPYFIDTYEFVSSALINNGIGKSPVNYYDALNRITHVFTEKGFLIANQWTSWSETSWDENDTLMLSPYFIQNRLYFEQSPSGLNESGQYYFNYQDERLNPNSMNYSPQTAQSIIDSIKKAQLLAWTPGSVTHDNRGLVWRGIQISENEFTPVSIESQMGMVTVDPPLTGDQYYTDLTNANYIKIRTLILENSEQQWGEITTHYPIADIIEPYQDKLTELRFQLHLTAIISVLFASEYNDDTLTQTNLQNAFEKYLNQNPFIPSEYDRLYIDLKKAGYINDQGKAKVEYPILSIPNLNEAENKMANIILIQGWTMGNLFITTTAHDEIGRPVSIADPRFTEHNEAVSSNEGNIKEEEYYYSMQYFYAGSVSPVVQSVNCDAGVSWALVDVMGRPLWNRDARGTTTTLLYDNINRPLSIWVESSPFVDVDGTLKAITQWGPVCVSRIQYGEFAFDPTQDPVEKTINGNIPTQHQSDENYSRTQEYNFRGKPVATFTQGIWEGTTYGYNILGLPFGSVTKIIAAYSPETATSDILPPPGEHFDVIPPYTIIPPFYFSPLYEEGNQQLVVQINGIEFLMTEWFTDRVLYDAAGQIQRSWDAANNVHIPYIHQSGGLEQMKVNGINFIDDAQYNAKKQKISMKLMNEEDKIVVKNYYTYDPMNYRLNQIYATHSAENIPREDEYELIYDNGNDMRQNLIYTLDPIGNVASVDGKYQGDWSVDSGMPPGFAEFDASGTYTYDAMYRLIEAIGYEDSGTEDEVIPEN